MPEELDESELAKEQEEINALTVAHDFDSAFAKKQAERADKLEQSKDVTVYEGQVPLHQRLTLLCQDFLESTLNFDINDLHNFQQSLQGQDKNIRADKLAKLHRIVKELFKKYQLEIVQPDLDYIIKKSMTAFDKHKARTLREK